MSFDLSFCKRLKEFGWPEMQKKRQIIVIIAGDSGCTRETVALHETALFSALHGMQDDTKLPATRRKRKKHAPEESSERKRGGASRADDFDSSQAHQSSSNAELESSNTITRNRSDGRHRSSSESSNDSAAADDDAGAWDDTVQRFFVEALFEIGITQASPSVLMEHMNFSGDRKPAFSVADFYEPTIAEEVNSERVKSHLQKYRKNAAKSLSEFFLEYDRWMEFATKTSSDDKVPPEPKRGEVGRPLTLGPGGLAHCFPDLCQKMIKDNGIGRQNVLRGGDLAAFLSFATMREDKLQQRRQKADMQTLDTVPPGHNATLSTGTSSLRNGGSAVNSSSVFPGHQHECLPSAREYSQLLSNGSRIAIPKLSKHEESSMLGKSFHQVASLFQNVSRLIMAERTTPHAHSYHEESAMLPSATDPPKYWVPRPPSRGLDNN
jgi:hypothetical protein